VRVARTIPEPAVDGWLVGMSANLRRADGTVPPVDVIHLHHGVWFNVADRDATTGGPERFYAAGEEKTSLSLPAGYGYAFHATDHWAMSYMLHNQLSKPDVVWITYTIDFVPATAPPATGITAARPIWMDVENGKGYPVFDVNKGSGTNGTYTFPDQAANPYPNSDVRNRWTVPADGVLLATSGHVHPGGLHDDLWLTRAGAIAPKGTAKPGSNDTTKLFTSVANYYEPLGNVSWDVSMSATPPSWRPTVRKGDVLSITTTYDSSKASWYESMGIMVVWMANTTKGGVDPLTTPVDQPGALTHGHLAENDNHGGALDAEDYEDVGRLPSDVVPSGTVLPIADFAYFGDMSFAKSIPTVVQGGSLTFRNDDAAKAIWHTITACAAPCNHSTGIGFPLANGQIGFDSGELGFGTAPAAETNTWSTPKTLPPGTYTYFCRIHPFMRGAFRVEAKPA
jgi:plastocyanin